MDPISNVDRLVRLLRSRLEARKASHAAERPSASEPADAGEIDALLALVTAEDVADGQLKRALIEQILTDHFGPALRNEARFQQIADRVTETLEADPASDELMAQAIKDLRTAVRT